MDKLKTLYVNEVVQLIYSATDSPLLIVNNSSISNGQSKPATDFSLLIIYVTENPLLVC